ncbi:MAG: hypothetical protein AAB011_06205 [Candidatus Eisenbacteria bacterium]
MPPKVPKFKSKDAEWTEDVALYIKDYTLAKFVYDAIKVAVNFRLVIDGGVVYSRTTAAPPPAYTASTNLLWPGKDMDWDDAGCLIIKDTRLAAIIASAKANGDDFKLEVPLAAVATEGDGGGIGESKANAMCAC